VVGCSLVQDVPGQYERSHMRAKICPISESECSRNRSAEDAPVKSSPKTVLTLSNTSAKLFNNIKAVWLRSSSSQKAGLSVSAHANVNLFQATRLMTGGCPE